MAAALALSAFSGAAQACNNEPYIGSVCVYAMDWCPRGYVPPDGRTLPIQTYTALFGLVGFQYGGDGKTQFQIPDLRGRVPVGTGTGVGLAPIAFTQKLGQQSMMLTTAQTPLPAHSHPATFTVKTGAAPVTIPATPGTLEVKAALPVDTAVGNVTGEIVALGSGTGYLAGMRGTTGVDPVTFSGPYSSTHPAANAPTLPANVTVTGTAGTAALTVDLPSVTGGTVLVGGNTPVNPPLPVSTQLPALGMSVCLAVEGLYPSRP